MIASHDLALIARMRHRMLTLQRGRLIGDGEAGHVRQVSERVAPKPADPQPAKKNAAKTMTARTSARCCTPGWKATVPAWLTAPRLGKQPIGSFFTCLVMAVALSMPMGLLRC